MASTEKLDTLKTKEESYSESFFFVFVFTKVCVSLYIIYYTHKQHYTFKVHRKKTRTRRRSERRNGGCVKSSFYVFFYSQFLFSLVFSQVFSHSNPKGCLSLRFFGRNYTTLSDHSSKCDTFTFTVSAFV